MSNIVKCTILLKKARKPREEIIKWKLFLTCIKKLIFKQKPIKTKRFRKIIYEVYLSIKNNIRR